jgi:hypothetical protein
MKYNAVFIYRDVIALGPVNPFATGSIATIDNTNYTERPEYVDWSTAKLKRGDNIYYNKLDRDSVTDELLDTSTPTSMGVLNTEPTATRLTVADNVGDDVYRDFLKGNVNIYAVRRKNLTGRCVYSYPVDRYVGACDFSDSIISLFFERTSGLIDEVRLNVEKNAVSSAILKVNAAFTNIIKGDCVFDETGNNIKSNVVYGVNKVISTIPANRN